MATDPVEDRSLHLPSLASKLPRDWSWRRLDACCGGIFDCPHSTPQLTNYGPFVVRSQDVRTATFRANMAARVSEETYKERIQRAEPRHGDLLYSREGTYFGIAAEVPPNTQVCLGQRMVLLRPDPSRIDFRFLKYWLNSPILSAHVEGRRDGTVAERLNLPTIHGLPVPVPPLPNQVAIGRILGMLDDKIELNSRTNETLEAMARTMFKSWFIEFDPIRIKAAGRSSGGLDPATDALFPDRFEESPLGKIPKGWRTATFGDVAANPRRGIQPHNIEATVPYLGLEHMPRRSITLDEWGNTGKLESNKFAFKRGEILFGKLRPYFHKVGVAPVDGVCSTDILVVVPKERRWFGFVLGHVSSDDFVSHTDGASTGTKMPRTSWNDMARYKLVIPPVELAARFTDLVAPLVQRIEENIHESHALAAVRAALLPKLLSGELCVPSSCPST